MNPVNPLLEAILENPADGANRLVLADWLEERGDEDRARLLRLQVERDGLPEGGRRVRKLDRQAQAILKARPELIGALGELCEGVLGPGLPVLPVGPVLAMFLVADLAEVMDGPLKADSTWQGELLQPGFEFPTTLWLRTRQGNQITGDMHEDFHSMYQADVTGTFFFRGVVIGQSHLFFVTHHVEGNGIYPGLYELHLRHGGWLIGTWWVPGWGARGGFRLRHRLGTPS